MYWDLFRAEGDLQNYKFVSLTIIFNQSHSHLDSIILKQIWPFQLLYAPSKGWCQLKSNHILNTIAVFSMGPLKGAESWKWKRWQTTLLWNKCVRNNSKWQMSNESFKWHLRQEVWMSTNKVTKWIWMVILWAIQIF